MWLQIPGGLTLSSLRAMRPLGGYLLGFCPWLSEPFHRFSRNLSPSHGPREAISCFLFWRLRQVADLVKQGGRSAVHLLMHARHVLTRRMVAPVIGHSFWVGAPEDPSPPNQPQPGGCEHRCCEDRCGPHGLPWLPRTSLGFGNQSPQGRWRCQGAGVPPMGHQGAPLSVFKSTGKQCAQSRILPCAGLLGLRLAFAALLPPRGPSAGSPQGQRQEGPRLCLRWVLIWKTAGTPLLNHCCLPPYHPIRERGEWFLR